MTLHPSTRGLAALVLALPVVAQASDAVPRGTASLATDHIGQVLLGLLAVIAAIGASAWVGRRVLRVSAGAGGHLRLLGGLSLGPRERVVLIQAGETQLLVGVAPGRVQTLHVLAEPLALEAESREAAAPSFRALLDRVRDARGGAA